MTLTQPSSTTQFHHVCCEFSRLKELESRGLRVRCGYGAGRFWAAAILQHRRAQLPSRESGLHLPAAIRGIAPR